jgi:hypothetical protein
MTLSRSGSHPPDADKSRNQLRLGEQGILERGHPPSLWANPPQPLNVHEKTGSYRPSREISMVPAENQVLQNKEVTTALHSLVKTKKWGLKMKVYPYGLLKTKELKK